MNNFLFKKFIKNHEDVNNPKVRDSYGRLAGIAGILSNAVLCFAKVVTGLLSGSIAILADGLNNLADASSSVVTLVGFKLASMPEDEEHPYGHARIEYLAGLIVSFMIMLVGFELAKGSLDKIINPVQPEFSTGAVVVLLLSIAVKFWQSRFNINIGRKINSLALIATGTDSRNDVISTTVVLIGLLMGHYLDLQVDGYFGMLVALFIIWSGFNLVKETINPLLGEAPDPELVTRIETMVKGYEGVLDTHDLVVHTYGPGKVFASIHIEVDAAVNVLASHDLVDKIEHDVASALNIQITAHMDPVDLSAPYRDDIIQLIKETIDPMDGVIGMHDLRLAPGYSHTKVIFDIVVSPSCQLQEAEVQSHINAAIQEKLPTHYAVIDFDKPYTKMV